MLVSTLLELFDPLILTRRSLKRLDHYTVIHAITAPGSVCPPNTGDGLQLVLHAPFNCPGSTPEPSTELVSCLEAAEENEFSNDTLYDVYGDISSNAR